MKRSRRTAGDYNYELFQRPVRATRSTEVQQPVKVRQPIKVRPPEPSAVEGSNLPPVSELKRLFDRFNQEFFEGRLPRVRIEYSKRMQRSAGSYHPVGKVIRIGRRYHELFPEEIEDTLKHEMIHIIHLRHNAAFKREARRLGTSVQARSHPSLGRPPKHVYVCPGCGREYPRQKRIRMASCGKCSRGGRYDPRFKLQLKR